MSESGVPVVPGYFGDDQSDHRLKEEADKIGCDQLIKTFFIIIIIIITDIQY